MEVLSAALNQKQREIFLCVLGKLINGFYEIQ